MSFILGSTASKKGGSTSMTVWFSTRGNGEYKNWSLVPEVLNEVLCYWLEIYECIRYMEVLVLYQVFEIQHAKNQL